MTKYRIVPFEGRPDVNCSDEFELVEALERLGKGTKDAILVNVHADDGRGAIIGLGLAESTLQLIDMHEGVTHRAISNRKGDDVEFLYQGETTYITACYLIPQEIAYQALTKWLTTDELIAETEWSSGPCPPRPLGTMPRK